MTSNLSPLSFTELPLEIRFHIYSFLNFEDEFILRRFFKKMNEVPYSLSYAKTLELNQRIIKLNYEEKIVSRINKAVEFFFPLRDCPGRFIYKNNDNYKLLSLQSPPSENTSFANFAQYQEQKAFSFNLIYGEAGLVHFIKDEERIYAHAWKANSRKIYLLSPENHSNFNPLSADAVPSLQFVSPIQGIALLGKLLAVLMDGKIHIVNKKSGKILKVIQSHRNIVCMNSNEERNGLICQEKKKEILYLDFNSPAGKTHKKNFLFSFKVLRIVRKTGEIIRNIFIKTIKYYLKHKNDVLTMTLPCAALTSLSLGACLLLSSVLPLASLIIATALAVVAIFGITFLAIELFRFTSTMLLLGIPLGIFQSIKDNRIRTIEDLNLLNLKSF